MADLPGGLPVWVRDDAGGAVLSLKAVPGAKHDQIAGELGDRLKVRISAPPEGGKANKAICELLASALGVKTREVEIIGGTTSPEKQVVVRTLTAREVAHRLGGNES